MIFKSKRKGQTFLVNGDIVAFRDYTLKTEDESLIAFLRKQRECWPLEEEPKPIFNASGAEMPEDLRPVKRGPGRPPKKREVE